jgi:hypothetical protein
MVWGIFSFYWSKNKQFLRKSGFLLHQSIKKGTTPSRASSVFYSVVGY